MGHIIFKYPTRSRPEIFKIRLQSYYDFLSADDFEFIISADFDDPTMYNTEIMDFVSGFPNCTIHFGNSKTKVQACNADVPGTLWDIIVLVSDDMVPVVPDFDVIIRSEFGIHFPDFDGALWFKVGRHDRICTLSILGRQLYDYFGYIYHPAFATHYCDDLFTRICRGRGCIVQLPYCIFKHDWTIKDALMARNENKRLTTKDRETYLKLSTK